MTQTYALIKDGIVYNIALWDGISLWRPGDEFEMVNITDLSPCPNVGWVYDGSNFLEPTNHGNEIIEEKP